MINKEYNLQVACVDWLDWQYPNLLRTISPITRLSAIQGKRQKKLGYKAGSPDLMIFEPNNNYHGLFVEFKVKPNKTSKEQEDFLGGLNAKGYLAAVIYTIDDFMLLVKEYFNK